jgi:hypothetical protein
LQATHEIATAAAAEAPGIAPIALTKRSVASLDVGLEMFRFILFGDTRIPNWFFFCNLTAKLNLSFFKIPFSSYFSGRETVATFAASAIIPLPVPLICIIECRSLPLYLPPQLHKRSQRYRNSGWMMY